MSVITLLATISITAIAPGRESGQMNGVQFSQTGEQRVVD